MTELNTTIEDNVGAGSRSPWGPVAVGEVFEFSRIGESQFAVLVFERGLAHAAQLRWRTDAGSLESALPYALATSRAERARSAVLDLERVVGGPCLAFVQLTSETLHVRIAATEQPTLSEAETWLRGSFAVSKQSDDQPRVPVSFWSYGTYTSEVSRSITVPIWEEIAENYPHAVGRVLGLLCDEEYRPSAGGQLLLWHGDPGTGKTYALRALAWAWREWCDLHYVTDPENFFGSRADYMMEVLLEEDEERPDHWRLLVLEDTGDLLTVGGGGGAGLSRLLNVVDGIVGQGLRILVLVTTNEPLKRLHPAVSRPGRCAARVEFAPFEPEEAAAWLERHGRAVDVPDQPTLARLFAQLRDDDPPVEEVEKPRFGFGQ